MNRMAEITKITGAIALVLILGLTGCGKGNNPVLPSAAGGASSKLEPVTLNWYMVFTPQPEQQLVFTEFNKITEQKLNTTVNFNIFDWGIYQDKMQVLLAAGDPVDLCFTAHWYNPYLPNVGKGAYLPLDDLLAKYAKKSFAQIPAKFWDAAKVKGKIYGFINYQASTMTKGVWLLKSLADKYAFDPGKVSKLEDIEPFLKTIKEKEPNLIPFGLDKGLNAFELLNCIRSFDILVNPVAVASDDVSLKAVNLMDTLEMKKLLSLARDWYNKGYIRKDAAIINNSETDQKAGKIAAGPCGNIIPGGVAASFQRFGQRQYQIKIGSSILQTNSATATMFAIPTVSVSPERAMMLLELINTDKEAYNLLNFGIEGKHYKKVSSTRIEPAKDSKYNPGVGWEIGNQFNAYLIPGQDDDVWEETKKLNESAMGSVLLGFTFDSKPVTAEVANCNSIWEEFKGSLLTGSADPEVYLPRVLEKYKNAGINKIIAEAQKQIDAWKATK